MEFLKNYKNIKNFDKNTNSQNFLEIFYKMKKLVENFCEKKNCSQNIYKILNLLKKKKL